MTVWQGDGKRLGLREYVGKLAVRQPGKMRAESLAVWDLDLEHDASGQLDGDAAACHGNLDWRKRCRFGAHVSTDAICCVAVNPEGQADVSSDNRGRSLVPVLLEKSEVGVLVWPMAAERRRSRFAGMPPRVLPLGSVADTIL